MANIQAPSPEHPNLNLGGKAWALVFLKLLSCDSKSLSWSFWASSFPQKAREEKISSSLKEDIAHPIKPVKVNPEGKFYLAGHEW